MHVGTTAPETIKFVKWTVTGPCRHNSSHQGQIILFLTIFTGNPSRVVGLVYLEHMELPVKLLDYFLRSKKSNINQYLGRYFFLLDFRVHIVNYRSPIQKVKFVSICRALPVTFLDVKSTIEIIQIKHPLVFCGCTK